MDPFYFIQAADTQLGLIDSFFHKKLGWDKEIDLIQKMIQAVNQMTPKPKFLIVCGDMVNAYPGEECREDQYRDHKRLFDQLDKEIPLVCVCGNHDVGDTPTVETITKYRNDFGPDYFSFVVNDVLMIIINSQYYADASQVPDLAKEHDQWLDETLALVKQHQQAIVFQHIPWFISDPDGERTVMIMENGYRVYFDMEMETRRRMLNKLYDAGIRSVFCGHYHRNAGGHFKDMQQVVTSAVGAQLGSDKSGIRIVTVTQDAVQHQYYDLDSIPTTVSL